MIAEEYFTPNSPNVIHEVIDLSDVRRGHEMMEANLNTGKIVMVVNRELCDG